MHVVFSFTFALYCVVFKFIGVGVMLLPVEFVILR